MNTLKWIALGCVIAGVILLLVSFLWIKFDFSKLAMKPLVTNTYQPEQSFTKLDIQITTGHVKVLPAQDGKCSVVCKETENMPFAVKVEEDTLIISQEDNRKWYAFIGIVNNMPSVTVYLPQESYELLTVNGTTADVIVENGVSYELASVKMTTGDLVWSAQVNDKLTAKTTTGDLAICDVSCKELDAKITTGDVKLTDVVVENKLTVNGGTSDVILDAVDGGEIEIHVTTGDVEGTLLTEKVFITKTTTGDINVPESTEGGVCRVKTTTGDVKLRIVK